jgi:pimeloyl-ACP methyl ester carboxylesterase
MRQVMAVDGFQLAYERAGQGPAVLLLHGWPGDRSDYREVVPLIPAVADVVAPDLRGFGGSDRHPADLGSQYSAGAQARSIIGPIEELGPGRPVIAGYDIGNRIAQGAGRSCCARPTRPLVMSSECQRAERRANDARSSSLSGRNTWLRARVRTSAAVRRGDISIVPLARASITC